MLLFPGKVSTLLRVRFSVKVLRKIQINAEYFLMKPKPFYILHRFQFTKQNSTFFSLCLEKKPARELRATALWQVSFRILPWHTTWGKDGLCNCCTPCSQHPLLLGRSHGADRRSQSQKWSCRLYLNVSMAVTQNNLRFLSDSICQS